jgi:Rrf2 family transcriptional regulator, iron-sulfur cluster assembly transcription factor
MRLELNRLSDYAIRACMLLASDGGHPISGREIAARTAVPERFLARSLGQLVSAGVVESRIGRTGGYRLGREASDVSLLEIVEAVEGPSRSTRCVLRQQQCDPSAPCAIHPVWAAAQSGVIDVLAGASLAALVESEWAIDPTSPRALIKERTVR